MAKEDTRTGSHHIERRSTPHGIRKLEVKTASMTQLREGPKSAHGQHPMPARTPSSRAAHSRLEGTQDGAATWEDSLVVSRKLKHALPMLPSNHAPWYLPKGAQNLSLHKNLHVDVCSSPIHSCQNLEAFKTSFRR